MKITGTLIYRRGCFFLAGLHGRYLIHTHDELRFYPLSRMAGEDFEGEIEQSPVLAPTKDAAGWIRTGTLNVLAGAK